MGVTPRNRVLLRLIPHRLLFESLPPPPLKVFLHWWHLLSLPIVTNSFSSLRSVTNDVKLVLIFMIMKIERLYYPYHSSSSSALNVEKLIALILLTSFL